MNVRFLTENWRLFTNLSIYSKFLSNHRPKSCQNSDNLWPVTCTASNKKHLIVNIGKRTVVTVGITFPLAEREVEPAMYQLVSSFTKKPTSFTFNANAMNPIVHSIFIYSRILKVSNLRLFDIILCIYIYKYTQ